MQEKQIIIQDQLINYLETNPTAEKTAVFLHGWQSNAQVWTEIITKLSKSQIRLICIDLPGFGKSQPPKGGWGVGEYAELVKDFLAKLEISKATIIGHSFGGRVAIKLSAKNPELVEKLVLIDAAGFKNETILNKLKVLAAKTVKPLFSLPLLKQLKEKTYKVVGASDYAAAGPLRETFVKTINEDLTEYLPKISVPTLLIWGAKDQETPLAFGQVMNRLIPNSKLIIFDHAGHFSFLDESEKTIQALEGFIL